jgi:hypothetical protein
VRPQSVVLLTLAILLATIGFGFGAALEKATPAATSTQTSSGEAVGSSEVGGESHAAASETVLGINPESVPLIAAALVASLVLAVGIWLYWRRAVILWVAAGAMFAFAALDVIEVVHQLAVQHPALVAVAAVVAILHLLAAILAIRLGLRRTALEPAVA